MASTCIPCQAEGHLHTFDDPEDYNKHMREKHGPEEKPTARRAPTPRTAPRRSPRQPKRKK